METIEIRKIGETEREAAVCLIDRVFMRFEAPDYSSEGVQTFYQSALNNEEFLRQLTMYGAYGNDALLGVIATRSGGSHIAFFFVDGAYHRQGIGKKLFLRALADCPAETLSVHSSPYATEIYHKLGFTDTADEQTENGIRYTPMVYTKRPGDEVKIRCAHTDDARALLEIYAYYVEHTAVSFEYDTPSETEFAGRMEAIMKKYPYFVAQIGSEIVGYAYAAAFKSRAAYARSVETTVYVVRERRGMGIGRRLYEALEAALIKQNVLNMNAGVAFCEAEDEYLPKDSSVFHEHMGFVQVAHFHGCGFKFNRWYDLLWFEKSIGAHTEDPAPLLPFDVLRQSWGEK